MTHATRPAAYLRLSRTPHAAALTATTGYPLARAAQSRGWPVPAALFIDYGSTAPSGGPALRRLTAAIEAGRYDALLLAGTGSLMSSDTPQLMRLLRRCTRNGIPVALVLPADH